MKKVVKVLLILSIAFVLIGAAVFGVGLFLNWDYITSSDYSSSGFEQKQYEHDTNGLTAISFNDINSAVKILPTSSDKVRVSCYESDKEHYYINKDADGTLIIERRDERKWFERISFWSLSDLFGGNKSTVIEIPSNVTLDNIDIETINGRIEVGDLKLKESLTAKTQNGEVVLKNVNAEDEVEAETTNGRITLSDIKAKSVIASAVNGRIDLASVNASKSLDFETVNGEISGSVVGDEEDFKISADTVLGKCNLSDKEYGIKMLTAGTVNGRIEIEFEE